MFNTIRLKILPVATPLLVAFAVTTGFSTYLNKEIVEEMQTMTEYHIPLSAHVASIDVLTFELELQFRRALVRAPLTADQVTRLHERHTRIVKTLRADVATVASTLDGGVADPRNDL